MGGMSIELSELRDAAQKAFPADHLAPPRDTGWSAMAEMGWLMLPLSEDAGGLGLGRAALATIHAEMGRMLSRAPLVPALGVLRALESGEALADRGQWLERLATGEYIAASLDFTDASPGTLRAVPDADMASHVLVTAPGLVALAPTADATLAETRLWDDTRRLFDVTPGASLTVVARGAGAEAITARLREDLMLGIAADALGGAGAVLAMTVDYLRTRRQFERPLAMFQALKHRCADLKTQIEAAEALLFARAVEGARAQDIGAMKALACETFRFTAEEAIQLHGGIGLTQEHACHRFMKRAELNCWLAGSADALNEAAGRAELAG